VPSWLHRFSNGPQNSLNDDYSTSHGSCVHPYFPSSFISSIPPSHVIRFLRAVKVSTSSGDWLTAKLLLLTNPHSQCQPRCLVPRRYREHSGHRQSCPSPNLPISLNTLWHFSRTGYEAERSMGISQGQLRVVLNVVECVDSDTSMVDVKVGVL